MVPDLHKLYLMFASVLACSNKKVVMRGLILLDRIWQSLLPTEMEVSWRELCRPLLWLAGAEDEQLRKKGKEAVLGALTLSKNAHMILEKLYYEGSNEDKQDWSTKIH